jgi:hypothetical protein
MTIDVGSLVLRLSRPWGLGGMVERVDGDVIAIRWEDGRTTTHHRSTLCLAENVDRPMIRSSRPQHVKR